MLIGLTVGFSLLAIGGTIASICYCKKNNKCCYKKFGIKSTPSSNSTTLLYPNPAINLVTVEFETNRKAAISADVYDMQGKLVAHVFDDAAKDGLNRFSFNTQNLASGNYLLRITASGATIVSKKFVVE